MRLIHRKIRYISLNLYNPAEIPSHKKKKKKKLRDTFRSALVRVKSDIRRYVNNFPQCSCTCVSVCSTRVTQVAHALFHCHHFCAGLMLLVSSIAAVLPLIMAAPLYLCTKEEQRSVIRFYGRKLYQGPQSIKDFRYKTGTVYCRNGVSRNELKN